MRIAVIDPSPSLRRAILEALAASVTGEEPILAEAADLAEAPAADLMILGLNRAEDRIRLLALVEAPPVIVLIGDGAGAVAEAIAGFDKPVRLGDLMTTVDGLVQAFRRPAAQLIGALSFDPVTRALRRGTSTIRLTEKEAAMLAVLTAADRATVTREQLLAEVWGYGAEIDTHTLESHIWRLRQKLETDPADARHLLTEPGGYRLVS